MKTDRNSLVEQVLKMREDIWPIWDFGKKEDIDVFCRKLGENYPKLSALRQFAEDEPWVADFMNAVRTAIVEYDHNRDYESMRYAIFEIGGAIPPDLAAGDKGAPRP